MMLGQNGTGKTTFIKMLAGLLKPDDDAVEMPKLSISYKPQTIAPKFQGTVQELMHAKLKEKMNSSIFKTEVLIPLNIDDLMDNEVQTLSGGELQRVAITLALGKTCDIYLIDEPSAYLDSE
jgi:ATP-binding cassette subfamily E protein 1